MNYLQLPNGILPHLARLSGVQVAIWADAWTWEQQGAQAYRTNAQLAEMLGVTVKSVSCAITNLRNGGYLEWTMVNGRQRILKATIPSNVHPPVERKASRSTSIPSNVKAVSRPTSTLHPVELPCSIPSNFHQVDNRVEQVVNQLVEKEETDRERMARIIAQMEARERGEEVPQAAEAIPVPATIRPARGAARAAVVSNKAQPFDVQEVIDYFLELEDTPEEAANFYDYWTSAGWRRKAGPIKDWKATARTWVRSPYRKPKPKTVIDTARAVMEDFLNNPR